MNARRPFEPRPARALVYQWWLLGFSAPLLAASLVWIRVPGLMSSFAGLMAYLALTILPGVPAALLLLKRRRESGLLTVAPDGVYLGARRLVGRTGIAQAVAFRSKRGAGVRISRRHIAIPCDVELDSDADAQDFLESLSKDSRQATAAFSTVKDGFGAQTRALVPILVVALASVGAVLGASMTHPHLLAHLFARYPVASWLTVLLAYVSLVGSLAHVARRSHVRLVVGADGILAIARRGVDVFHPYHSIRDVRRERGDVILELASGQSPRFGVGGAHRAEGEGGELVMTALLTRISDAREAYATSGSASDLAGVLARGGRDVSTWRASLTALLGEPATYRKPAVPPETLWRVLEDPTQPATARAGAAVALRATLDDGTRVRLRVATATCASVELRGAFEAALEEDEDDAEVERSLQAFAGDTR